jgi:hypothetical protein
VDKDDGHHEIRAPPVHGADKPAQSYIVVQRLQTAPSLARRRNINQGQQDSRDELEKEDGECSAAEDIEPTGRVSRHGMLRRFTNGSGQLQALVKPLPDLSDQTHVFLFPSTACASVEADSLLSMETNSFRGPHGGVFPKREAVGDPGVGNSPA